MTRLHIDDLPEDSPARVIHDAMTGKTSLYPLTKREYIATHILAGLAANPSPPISHPTNCYAGDAVKAADALIKALNETSEPGE